MIFDKVLKNYLIANFDNFEMKKMCGEHWDTSTWGYQHDDGQGSALGYNQPSVLGNYFTGHQQQNYGYQTDYGNQHIYGYQQNFGDYTGHRQYIGHGHEQYTGHGNYNMEHFKENMEIQGGSGYHVEEDTDAKEEGEFSD
ncbi:unnamed protein product [Meloidogyne enterolobii]|uniref:Uncharacterized protein n=1 Tax=Meloidogyne enterolobii TaxID=390850 RepID=A0ACB0Y2B1_MELEN